MCPEGFVLGPDWKNCDDVDECAAGDNHDNENQNHDNHDTHDNYNHDKHDNHDKHNHNGIITDNDECTTGDCHFLMYLYDLL